MSSAEAEYRPMAYTLKELKWLKQLLNVFGINHTSAMCLYYDSKSAIYIAANPVFHERTKHIESDCHFVRDAVQYKLTTTKHISIKEQPANILTKLYLLLHSLIYFLSWRFKTFHRQFEGYRDKDIA